MRKFLSLFIVCILIFAAGCHRTPQNTETQTQNFLAGDSLWTPTGDVQLDSMLQLAVTMPQDTNLIKLYFEIGSEYYRHHDDFDNAKIYYFKANRLSEELNWSLGHFQFASKYTNILNKEGLMDSAIVISNQALKLAKKEMNEKWITNLTMNLGVCYYIKNWYETSLEYYHEALPLVEKQGNRYRLAHLYDLMGILYSSLSMYDESLEYAEKAIEIWNEKPDTLQRANALINYASLLSDLKAYDKAESALLEAQRVANLNNNKANLIKVYSNLGVIALKKFDLNKAESYLIKELALLGNSYVESHCLVHLNLSCVELYRGNFNKSEEYVNKALKIAIEYELLEAEKECYKNLMQLATTQHNFRLCEFYTEKADSIEKLLTYEENRKNAQEMEVKYETEKKQLEIERQQSTIEKQNLQRWLLVGGIGACGLILIVFLGMLRLRARRNRALAELNATKDKFFSIISHDLKNPAVAQRDAIKMLFSKAEQWDAITLQNFCGELLHSADMQVELLYNLLNWAQLQSGRMIYQPETFPLAQKIVPELALIRRIAEDKGVQFEAEISQACIITADADMIATVVRNLLSNAVKFTPSGGTVKLEVATGRDAINRVSTKHTISITDTGIGIPSEEFRKIFRIDSRHSRRGTAGETGTGLGLIVCCELLEKHGTKLQIESKEGKGSRFWFEI